MTPDQERLVAAMMQEQSAPQQAPPQESGGLGRNLMAAGELGLMALPFTRLGRAMFSTVPRAAASVAGITGAGVAGKELMQPAQAEGPDELSTVRDTIARIRTRQGELEDEEKQLKGQQQLFGRLNRNDPEAIRRAQETLQSQGLYLRDDKGKALKPDGVWGPGMGQAVADYQARITKSLETNQRSRDTAKTDLDTQNQRQTGLEGGQRLRESEHNVGGFSRALREYGELGGTALGLALGGGGRMGMVAKANAKAAGNARLVESMLGQKGTAVAPRAGRLAEVWRMGGQGDRPPFANAPGTKYGLAPNPNAAPTADLFPGRPGIRGQVTGSDLAFMGGFGAEAGVMEMRLRAAQTELADAQQAAQKDPSEINIARLQRATDAVAMWQTLGRVGQAGAVTYGVASTKTPRLYPRPDLSRADAEVANLNRLVSPPKPAPRKRKK